MAGRLKQNTGKSFALRWRGSLLLRINFLLIIWRLSFAALPAAGGKLLLKYCCVKDGKSVECRCC